LSRSFAIRWFSRFAPVPISVRWPERLRSCVGALIGIAFTGLIMRLLPFPGTAMPLLVAPMGASAVLLFAVPSSPLAQPWSIIGGNIVSATVGVFCAGWIADPVVAASVAAALAICAMFALRCVHPPSGAVALTAVLGGPAIQSLGYGFVLTPIAIQSMALLAAALVYHAVTGHRYPHAAREGSRNSPANGGFTRSDLDAVLRQRGELLDIDPDDLESLLREAQLHAYVRTFSALTCAHIMSRTVVDIQADTTVGAALGLLKRHGIKALPVTDAARRVTGIVTRSDLVDKWTSTRISLLDSLRTGWFGRGNQPAATVSTVMTTGVRTVAAATPIVELIPLFADHGHHHIPVLDPDRRLAGMITQADLISGLYRQAQAQHRRVA
jgi:CBS domain-containing membrane protein